MGGPKPLGGFRLGAPEDKTSWKAGDTVEARRAMNGSFRQRNTDRTWAGFSKNAWDQGRKVGSALCWANTPG